MIGGWRGGGFYPFWVSTAQVDQGRQTLSLRSPMYTGDESEGPIGDWHLRLELLVEMEACRIELPDGPPAAFHARLGVAPVSFQCRRQPKKQLSSLPGSAEANCGLEQGRIACGDVYKQWIWTE